MFKLPCSIFNYPNQSRELVNLRSQLKLYQRQLHSEKQSLQTTQEPDQDRGSGASRNIAQENSHLQLDGTPDASGPYAGATLGLRQTLPMSVTTSNDTISNPLVPRTPIYVSDLAGRLVYLGHSSNFAFSQQVLDMMRRHTGRNHGEDLPRHRDGSTYDLGLGIPRPTGTPDISELPSLHLCLHYIQCVKFWTLPLFCLFDELTFVANVHEFYERPVRHVEDNPLWFTHFLLIMAFAKAFVPSQTIGSGSPNTPPGARFFA